MHIPVLLKEVVEYLDPKPGKKFIDATYGGGGHTQALLEKGAKVLGIDKDEIVLSQAARNDGLEVVCGNYADLKEIAEANGFTNVDGILFDLGFGSHQLDDAERGFSFQKDGPLDMRYDRKFNNQNSKIKIEEGTAADIIRTYSEKDLARIFYQYGEEKRFGKRIARGIIETRKLEKIDTTTKLFELIKKSLPAKFRFKAADAARRIFQALRIEVNQELENLEKALPQALFLLKPGGKIAVISFHSLEDRIVKKFFLLEAKDCVCPPEIPVCVCGKNPSIKILTKKIITASSEEVLSNPRSKSAKMRVVTKI